MGCTQIGKQRIFIPSKSRKISKKELIKYSSADLSNKYTILKEIGSGASSSVYLAIQNQTSEQVALKAINKHKLTSILSDKKYKLSEAAILRKLDHPNIIKCFEVFENRNKVFISEEYIKGGSLRDYLKSIKVKLTENKIVCVMSQLMSAVNYCHQHKILHRDIKLENIFMSDDTVKLGDFGFAQKSKRNKNSLVLGTLNYMAPEVFTGKATEKSDIWACGVVLYVLVSGKFPCRVSDREDLLCSFIDLEAKIKALKVSSEISTLLLGMLKLDPNERLSASDIVKYPWLSQLEDLGVSRIPINNIINFPKKSKLQHSIILFQNCMFPSSLLNSELSLCFSEIDEDKNGVIDKKEFKKVIEKKFSNNSGFLTENFFRNFDLNCNGVIDYSEFLDAFCCFSEMMSEENLAKVFRAIDLDEKGYVSSCQIEEKLWVKLGEGIVGEVADMNRITVEEFIKIVKNK